MPSSGSGTGTPISSGVIPPTDVISPLPSTMLSLDRYQELMRIPIAAFNGLLKDDEAPCFDCAYVWKQTDRYALAEAIAQAEEMRIAELGYFPYPAYTSETVDYVFPLILSRKHLIAVGSETCTVISSGVALNLGLETAPNDPVVIAVATTVTNSSEIRVYHPGETIEIHPSSISISGGIATIRIPRARLISPFIDTNCDPPPSYYENDNFITSVDVKRCYTDPSTGAMFYWWGNGSCPVFPTLMNCCCDLHQLSTFAQDSQLAFADIINARLAIVKLYPGSFDGTTWTAASFSNCGRPDKVVVNYRSGRTLSMLTEMNTIRLAHTLLPFLIPDRLDLCAGCWKEDNITDEGAPITPYGSSRAAIKVWMSDSRAKIGQGGKFPSMRR